MGQLFRLALKWVMPERIGSQLHRHCYKVFIAGACRLMMRMGICSTIARTIWSQALLTFGVNCYNSVRRSRLYQSTVYPSPCYEVPRYLGEHNYSSNDSNNSSLFSWAWPQHFSGYFEVRMKTQSYTRICWSASTCQAHHNLIPFSQTRL